MDLLKEITRVNSLIGNTPLQKLNFGTVNLHAKLEYYQFADSIKVRPAYFILSQAIKNNLIDQETTIIESTSGNFGIALASLCRLLKIKFIPVIDPCISPEKEKILRLLAHQVIKVTERDETGGYLLNRIRTVDQYLRSNINCFNPNQYSNPNNYLSYYEGMGLEIANELPQLDYLFISVSSGGTITGLSRRLKEKYPKLKVVAVDVEGSLIFNNQPKTRHLAGMGSSKRTEIIEQALIDEVVILSESEIINGCHELLNEQMVFAGASSGAAYCAAKRILSPLADKPVNALFICPDNGSAYVDTVYNDTWTQEHIFKTQKAVVPV